MQPKSSHSQVRGDMEGEHLAPWPTRHGWSSFDRAPTPVPVTASWEMPSLPPKPLCDHAEHVLHADIPLASRTTAFELPRDKTITLSIIAGPSKGLAHAFKKPRISIGCAGSGADIEIDDPGVSALHCAVGVTEDSVRLCDMGSTNGTYVNDERIQSAQLQHLSEFRIGASWLLVTILPKSEVNL
jgi:type III secretion system (T3SS) inner membrane Yop/YscD-like protein